MIASHSPFNTVGPISETVRHRALVPKDHQQEMAYRPNQKLSLIEGLRLVTFLDMRQSVAEQSEGGRTLVKVTTIK